MLQAWIWVFIFTFEFIQCHSITELIFSLIGLMYRIFANTEFLLSACPALSKKGLASVSNSEGCTGCWFLKNVYSTANCKLIWADSWSQSQWYRRHLEQKHPKQWKIPFLMHILSNKSLMYQQPHLHPWKFSSSI